MLPYDFFRCIALDALGTVIPTNYESTWVQNIDRVVLNTIDQYLKAFLALTEPLGCPLVIRRIPSRLTLFIFAWEAGEAHLLIIDFKKFSMSKLLKIAKDYWKPDSQSIPSAQEYMGTSV